MDERQQWLAEYSNKKGIPSSFRTLPSGSVEFFYDFLKTKNKIPGQALDLGCGKGRNSFFLAQQGFKVQSIDFVPEVVAQVNETAKNNNWSVTAQAGSVTDPLPFAGQQFDIVIDVFCYLHQTDKIKQAKYRQEVNRVLENDGYYLLSLSGEEDGFYGSLLKDSPNPKEKLVFDPVAGVHLLLYSRQDVEHEFSDQFKILHFQEKRNTGSMHGKDYPRQTFIFIMQKSN